MNLLRRMASIFIDAFGITQPRPGKRDRAAVYIALLLLAVVALIGSVIALAIRALQK